MTLNSVNERILEKNYPLVSVIVPAYNASLYITDTLSSVFAQTCTDFEVILVNDGSPDTEQLEWAIQSFRDRIVYLTQDNRGPSAARNLGILHSSGQYLAFLDSDDIWLPEYLSTQLRMFEETPSLDMVYSNAVIFGDTPFSGKTYMEICPSDGPVTFESLITEQCQVILSCTMVRRHIFTECGLFDDGLRGTEDLHMWLRAAHNGANISYHRAVLGRYRIHPAALSSSATNLFMDRVRTLRQIESTLQLSQERFSLLRSQLHKFQAELDFEEGKSYLFGGQFDQARQSFRSANAYFCKTKVGLFLVALRVAPQLTLLGMRIWLGHKPVLKRD